MSEIRRPGPPPVIPQPAKPPAVIEAEEWARVSNTRSIDQLEEFRRRFPNGANNEQAARRIEQLEWEGVQGSNRSSDFEAFLRKYPNSGNADQARRRIEEIDWAGVNKQDANAIRAFLQRHPSGTQTATANAALAVIVGAQAAAQAAAQQAERLAADRRAVRQALTQFEQAYGSKNIQAITAMWPSIPRDTADTFRKAFGASRSLSMQLKVLGEPEIMGDAASVSCERTTQQVFDGGGKPLVNQNSVRVRLRRNGASWLIDAIN